MANLETPSLSPAPLRLFTWLPVTDLPTAEESDPDGHSILLALEGVGVIHGAYMVHEGQFYQHCERYDSFDDESIPGANRTDEINSCLNWEMEEVYPENHPLAKRKNTITHWMVVPDPPTE